MLQLTARIINSIKFLFSNSNTSFVLAREPISQAPVQSGSYQQQQMAQNPCQVEFQRFITCAQNQTELTMCDQFHQALKDCKILYSKFVMKLTIAVKVC